MKLVVSGKLRHRLYIQGVTFLRLLARAISAAQTDLASLLTNIEKPFECFTRPSLYTHYKFPSLITSPPLLRSPGRH
ncbi:uncharacterized protein EI90DRAFT_3047184 [Cantharellus anzutake]|uniref:uncharacterized protein n=1 Tax=Cantharellus anzutake TaxID=1750568 RepID=UPI001904F378|nr:uncharacterized protein EI90DRAFT_3047184 [Cantharellus anzutake]KAF8335804.1 hypothetical protein EI90DRAFT_3047184 [Cantharellus anzutake]